MSYFIINTKEMLKQRMDLIDSLINIQNGINAQKKKKKLAGNKRDAEKKILKPNPIDEKYNNLHCKLTPLDATNQNYKMI